MMEQANPNMFRKLSSGRQTALAAVVLFGLNAVICWPLGIVAYLDDFHSNEGLFISLGRYLLKYWPHAGWASWFNGGTPFEAAYFPLPGALVALIAAVGRCSPAHAFHFLAWLSYSLGPVFLFLFARKVSGKMAPALAAGLAWTLLSPALLLPPVHHDAGTLWGIQRLHTLVFYGEMPHNLALSLLPLAWLLLVRFWERPTARRLAPAVAMLAAIMVSNAFGLTVAVVSSGMLVLSLEGLSWKRLFTTGGVLIAAYLLISRFLPPSMLFKVARASQMLGGDFRPTPLKNALMVALAALMIAAWYALRRRPGAVRFAAVFAICFGVISGLQYEFDLGLLPSAHRYVLEAEVGISLLLGFALGGLLRFRIAAAAVVLVLAAGDVRFAQHWIYPADILHAGTYREARWIAANLPDERIMVSGDHEFWFNLFADNPQLSAAHEGAANWVERVAVFTIYSGMNAGDRDGPISVLWLKAFGCGAITVPGPTSKESTHAILNPAKFDGLLPLVWRENGDSVYRVPLRSTSLAHVVPSAAVVAARPMHGLDVGPLSRYVAALDDPAIPPAPLTWRNPESGQIAAQLAPGQVVTVQVTYDVGWRARVGGKDVPIREDGLGMMVLRPDCRGACSIDLEYTGGTERQVCGVIGLLIAILLLAGQFVGPKAGAAA
jgi:hypothetical protein